jgi:heme exporter protein C
MSLDLATRKPNWFSRLANPGQFLAWSGAFVLPLAIVTAVLFAVGLYLALFASPPDYQMGETVRIMYIHVPNAWLSQFVYAVMALAALGTLVWRHPLADVAAKSAAPLGATFTGLALFSGALWGRPTWGTFWEWDGRMTSTLVLFLIYLGIIALWRAFEDQGRAGRVIAVFTLVGALDIPIVKFSVDWWNTLHQPASVFTTTGEHMPPAMLIPLLVMTLAFTVLFVTLHLVRMRTEILSRRAEALARQAAASLAA